MNLIKHIACCLAFSMIFCIVPAAAQKKENSSDKPGSGNSRENNTAYIAALNKKIQGNYDEAATMFEALLKKFPNDHASMYELAEVYAEKNELAMAISWCTKATELAPSNNWYFLALADLYVENNEPNKAIVILEALCKKTDNQMEYVEQLALLYVMSGEYEKAVPQLNLIEAQTGISEELSLQKYKIYKTIGKDKKANEELEKLITYFPNETLYYSYLAESYMEMGLKKEALKIYNKILEINPKDPYVHIALADYYRMDGNMKKAKEELQLGFSNPDLDFEAKLQIVGALIQMSRQTGEVSDSEVKEMLRTITKAHPDAPEAWTLYADIALQEENYTEAQKALEKVLSNDSSHYTTWEMMMQVDYTLKDFQSLSKHATTTSQLFPFQYLPFLFGGIANFQLENYAKAVQMLERGKDLVFDDDATLEDFYLLLGDSYHQLKNNEKCFQYYDKVLEKNPKNALVLNNYAYYLSLSGKNLDKAEKMSYESLRIDPENPNNMDTYGWILYKMKRYDDAKLWIKKALDKDSNSATVHEHYGDILYQLGDVDEAVKYWKSAQSIEGDKSKLLDKKIADRKLYEE